MKTRPHRPYLAFLFAVPTANPIWLRANPHPNMSTRTIL